MRKIKFRGKVCGLEKYVYGDLLNTAQPCIVPTKGNHSPIPVEEDSIAQFVGYDADGKEIYEGDKICLTDDGNFSDVEMYIKFGSCFCPVEKKFNAFKLKGRGGNETADF